MDNRQASGNSVMVAGIDSLSPDGRKMVEYLELCKRYEVLKARANWHPGYKAPPELLKEIRARRARLSDFEQAAVADLMAAYGIRWNIWLANHLKIHPQDAIVITSFLDDLKHLAAAQYGAYDFPWRMAHPW